MKDPVSVTGGQFILIPSESLMEQHLGYCLPCGIAQNINSHLSPESHLLQFAVLSERLHGVTPSPRLGTGAGMWLESNVLSGMLEALGSSLELKSVLADGLA